MKRIYKAALLVLMALLATALVAACSKGGTEKPLQSVECGETVSWSQLLDGEVDWQDVVVRTPSGEREEAAGSEYRFTQVGEYTIEYGGVVYKLETVDTTAPVVQFVGDFTGVKKGDTVDLSHIAVQDNADGAIGAFTVSVTRNGEEVAVADKSFVANAVGEYTITVTASDAHGNRTEDHTTVTVEREYLYVVPVGTSVDVADLGYEDDLGAGYTYSSRVTSDGEEVALQNNAFTVQANRYYEIFTTATRAGEDAKELYVCYAAEGAYYESFDGGIPPTFASYGFDRAETIVYPDGNRAAKFSENSRNSVGQILIQREDTLRYRVSFDITVTGEFSDWALAVGVNASVEEEGVMIGNDMVGKTQHLRFTVTPREADKLICIQMTPHSDFLEHPTNAYIIDNLLITPLALPVYEGETLQEAEEGETLSFTAEALGIQASDYYGTALQPVRSAVEHFDGEETSAVTQESVAAQNGIYTVTFTVSDYWGNTAEYEVRISVGDTDFLAPEIAIAAVDRAVRPGTQILLDEQSLGLTIDDQSEYDLTFTVLKNGKPAEAASFTVGKAEYYEIFVTATDRSENANSAQAYMIVRSDELMMETFEGDADPYLIGAYQFEQSQTVILEDGSRAKKFFGNQVSDSGQITAQMGDTLTYRISFDIIVVGEFTDVWALSLGKNCALEGETVILKEDVGKKLSLSFTVPGRADGVLALLLNPHPEFFSNKENAFILDNVVFTVAEPPVFAGQTEQSVRPGDTLVFTAQDLGISANDCRGNALVPTLVSVYYNDGVHGETEVTEGSVTAQAGQYTLLFEAVDQWGNRAEFRLVITVAAETQTLDLTVAASDLTVAPDTAVALSEEALGLTVDASVAYTIRYEVSHNGGGYLVSEEGFTVGANDYYEIRITVSGPENSGLTAKGYVIVRSSSLNMMAMQGDALPADMGAFQFSNAEQTTDEYGNRAARFSGNTQNGGGQLLFQMTDTSVYTVSFDITVEAGTFVDTWTLVVGGAGTTVEEAISITAAQVGQTLRLTFTVTPREADKLICINLTPHSDFFDHPENAFTVDNVVFALAA